MKTVFDDVSLATITLPTPASIIELECLGDHIAELSAHLDAATARLLDLIREFDARGGWGNGFRSCAHWLTWRIGLDLGAARERVRVARALGTLPLLARALARGELSYSKVRALTRVATPETEERLLKVGRAGAAEHVERIVRGWRRVDRIAEAKQSTQRHRSRALHVYQDEDGAGDRGRADEGARRGPRGAVPTNEKRFRGNAQRRCRGTACVQPAAGRRAGPARRDGPPSRDRSGATRRAVPGRRPSMPRSWPKPTCRPTPTPQDSPPSRTAPTFPQRRPGGWRATRPAS